MGDLASPPLAIATSDDEMAPKCFQQTPARPASPDKTVILPQPNPAVTSHPHLGPGSAMFSTDLGKRAQRKLQGPPYAPVIVRSDRIQDVLMAAGLWLNKYPQQYLCIFPNAGWQIGDLWDEEDIHLETRSFCREVLQFIERDVYVRAKQYAQHWSRLHPERLHIVGGDLSSTYDKTDPLFIVDKIFVNGEQQGWPPIFLWHVAHIMRAAMLEVKGVKLPVKDVTSACERLDAAYGGSAVHSTAQITAMPEVTVALPPAATAKTNAATYVVDPPASMPVPPPPSSFHQGRSMPRVQTNGAPIQGSRYTEATVHHIPGFPGPQMGSQNSVHPNLYVPKNRRGRSASGSYDRSMPSGSYVENMPFGPPGAYHRQHAGSLSMAPSPRLNQAHMTMNHPLVNPPQSMAPFTYEQGPLLPGMTVGPLLTPGIMNSGAMPPQSIQNPSAMHGYSRQPPGPYGLPYATPMGDMTNMHYSHGMPPPQFESRRSGDRYHSQQYGNNSALYDPYEGANPSFRAGKKYNQTGFQTSNGRQRKISTLVSRPHNNQHTKDRPVYTQASGHRNFVSRGHSEDDPAITHDHEHGCHINWIGPLNTTVTEVFIKDLPENIQDGELEALFNDRIGVKPKSINTRSASQAQTNYLGRKHAFVGFSSAAIARQAINIRDPTVRGLSVSITVPKRFFQKIVEVPLHHMTESGPPFNSRYFSHANSREIRSHAHTTNEGGKPEASTTPDDYGQSFSPQDARSDLPKKKKGKQPQQESSSTGSPEARKTKPRKLQESPSKEVVMNATQVENSVPIFDTVKTVASHPEPQTEPPIGDHDFTSEEKFSPTEAADAPSLVGDHLLSLTEHNQQESTTAASQQMETPRQEDFQTVDTHTEMINQSVVIEADEKTPMDPSTKVPLGTGDVASDKELKNDASFRSPAESYPDLERNVESSADPHTVNHGTSTISPPEVTENPETGTPTLSSSNTLKKISDLASKGDTIPTAADNKSSTTDPMETTKSLEDPMLFEVSKSMQKEISQTPASVPVTEPVKKSGTQHTESLHPFSKASKSQTKKEKEQKRKAQKKEKEQAEKARAAKAVVINTNADEDDSPGKHEFSKKERGVGKVYLTAESDSANYKEPFSRNKLSSVAFQQDLKADRSVEASGLSKKATKAAINARDKPGKRKGKKAATADTGIVAVAESKIDGNGKPTDVTISIPNETGSVTKKEVKFDLPGDHLVSGAQPPEQVKSQDTPTGSNEPEAAVLSTTAKKNRSKKKKKPGRTWPSLEFRPMSPNPPFMGPIDNATDVQNYDAIMNEACGGEEDSDFSWDDLPALASSGEEKSSSASDQDRTEANNEGPDKATTTTAPTDDRFALKQQMYGGALYSKVEKMQPQLASKIIYKFVLELDDSVLETLVEDESALRAKVDEAASFYREIHSAKDGRAEGPCNAGDQGNSGSPTSRTCNNEDTVKRGIAVVNAQIAAHTVSFKAATDELAAATRGSAQLEDVQTPSETADPDALPAKKKKTNKHKKRKKQQRPNTTEEVGGPSDISGVAEASEIEKPLSAHATDDPNGMIDPFHAQLEGIEAIRRGEATPVDTQDSKPQHHVEVAKSLADPQFLRTMEGYLKETQGTSQAQGRKISKGDLI